MYRKYFSKFLRANEGIHHFACHSHHYWPDCTLDAQIAYWEDSAKMVDDKWEYFFSKKVPTLQRQIARVLNLSNFKNITFAPNTHELIYRLLSALFKDEPLKILTTDSEFYSFERQINRLSEVNKVNVTKIETRPFDDFEERFILESKNGYDVIFLSQVFFNSGFALSNLEGFFKKLGDATVIIDGYHGFMALPTDLSSIEDKIFYIAGSYKYSAGGEGCCFLVSPKGCSLKPEYTGWFAEIGTLSNALEGETSYSDCGLRFAGSTLDFTALYRQSSVFKLYEEEKISVEDIHTMVRKNQILFRKLIINPLFLSSHLDTGKHYGHFISFDLKKDELCKKVHNELKSNKISTDYRKSVLRFGFSLYQSEDDIIEAARVVNSIGF